MQYCYKCDNCMTEIKKTHGAYEKPDVYCYNCDNKMFKKVQLSNPQFSNKDFHGRKI